MSDYKTPNDKLITNAAARTLNATYKSKQQSYGVENNDKFCCSNWYSLEDLEGYINYVKEKATEKKITVDGIRFYFGVYPDSEKDKNKAGKNTLFMCPTTASVEKCSKDVTDIEPMNFGSTGNPPQNDYGE